MGRIPDWHRLIPLAGDLTVSALRRRTIGARSPEYLPWGRLSPMGEVSSRRPLDTRPFEPVPPDPLTQALNLQQLAAITSNHLPETRLERLEIPLF